MLRCSRYTLGIPSSPFFRPGVAMAAVVQDRSTSLSLKDPQLLRQQAYVNGAWIDSDSKKRIDVDNPADGSRVASVPEMGAAETKRAIEAAEAALPAWRALTGKDR